MSEATQDIVRKRISDWIEKGSDAAYLDLARLGLTELPKLPSNVQRIWFGGNKIKSIQNLPPSLTILDVTKNELESIDIDFPETLTDLFIAKNKLKCLPYLPDSLYRINMSYNKITSLPNIPSTLEWLYCWDNPVPRELIESDNMWMYDIVEESHTDRIELWKKYIKQL
jgi:hypothetical protein